MTSQTHSHISHLPPLLIHDKNHCNGIISVLKLISWLLFLFLYKLCIKSLLPHIGLFSTLSHAFIILLSIPPLCELYSFCTAHNLHFIFFCKKQPSLFVCKQSVPTYPCILNFQLFLAKIMIYSGL